MKIKAALFLFFFIFSTTPVLRASAVCPLNVSVVNIPAFLASGEEAWVHSFLVAQDKNGQPDLNRILSDKFFFVQAPILVEGEESKKIGLGFLHLRCGRKNLTFVADILVTRVTRKFLPNLGIGTELILASREGSSFIPRVQLWAADGGLIQEYQLLPSDGPVNQNLLEELFEREEEFWSQSSWWLEILTPTNDSFVAILNSPNGEFSKAEELVMGSKVSERILITNVSLPDLVVYRYFHWGISREILGLGQALKIENSGGFVFFDKPALVSKIRTLPLPKPIPN